MRAERISSRGGSENFYYLGKDQNQFFPNILIYKSQNLGEDWSSDPPRFRPHCLFLSDCLWHISSRAMHFYMAICGNILIKKQTFFRNKNEILKEIHITFIRGTTVYWNKKIGTWVWQIFKHFAGTFCWAQTSYFWRVDT